MTSAYITKKPANGTTEIQLLKKILERGMMLFRK